ncbi:MAG: Tol-Pal system beta propeller repeat protein TolB [Proteobacteria bacterium]|nr:MAG: Tol-Pal system beta propeller repeat protein TolB [Pseudomonadota bacterium]
MKINKLFRSLILLLVLSMVGSAWADLELRISKTSNRGIPIVIAPIDGGAHAIIEADLNRSGRFKIVSSKRATNMATFGAKLDPARLKMLGAAFLVRGRRTQAGLDVELISTATGRRDASYRIANQPNPRRVAHQAADRIFEQLIKVKGAFDTRLAYVTVTGRAAGNRVYRLYVSDADGYNPRVILTSHKPVMSPSWSYDGSQVAYVSFERGTPAVYVQNIYSGQKRMVSARKGINGAPSWSPDGKKLALSLSVDGNPEIYVLSLHNGAFKRLTNSRAIDTEPNWTQDGRSIIFTSDRGGRPQLYEISANGGGAKRVTYDGSYNSSADVKGDKIAFIRRVSGAFRVAVKDRGRRGANIVSDGRLDESPSFAPNATMVVYATQNNGRGTLSVVSDNGYARQELFSPAGEVREPAWSPYLR